MAQCKTYLQFVNKGDVSDERSEAHNAMMDTMRAEGFEFVNRDDARELAIQLVREVRVIIKPNDFIQTVLGCGLVQDIFPTSETGDRLVKVLWVRNVFKNQRAELIPLSMMPSAVVCTIVDVEDEISQTQARITKELDQVRIIQFKEE